MQSVIHLKIVASTIILVALLALAAVSWTRAPKPGEHPKAHKKKVKSED